LSSIWSRKPVMDHALMCVRPTQSIIYVPLQISRFQESILLIVQYKYLKSCCEDSILQNLILRTRLCGTGLITQPSWVFISTWSVRSGGNVLYHNCTSFEGVSQGRQPLNIFTWFRGVGRWLLLLWDESVFFFPLNYMDDIEFEVFGA